MSADDGEVSSGTEMVSAGSDCSDQGFGTVVESADEALVAALPQCAAISCPLRRAVAYKLILRSFRKDTDVRAFCARDIEHRSSRTLECKSSHAQSGFTKASLLESFDGQSFRRGSVLTLCRYVSLSANMLG